VVRLATAPLAGWRGSWANSCAAVTHFGYSGPAALDLSRHWVRAHLKAGGSKEPLRVTASFVPGVAPDVVEATWLAAVTADSRQPVRRFLGPPGQT
jgi:predicted flavoprotein YhiN